MAESVYDNYIFNQTSKYRDWILKYKNTGVHSKNFTDKLRELYEKLDTTTDKMSIIQLSTLVCSNLDGFIIKQLNHELYTLIEDKMTGVVCFGEQLRILFRLFHLQFVNQKIAYRISTKAFYMNSPLNKNYTPYFQIIKHILNDIQVRTKVKEDVINTLNSIFNDEDVIDFVKMEISDIFLLSGFRQRGEQCLEILRDIQRKRDQISTTVNIYQDSQNVHSKNISESVLKVAYHLTQKTDNHEFKIDEVRKTLTSVFPTKHELIHKILDRVHIDVSKFTWNNHVMSMYSVFANLWAYIVDHEHSQFLMSRLIEEFEEMEVYCSTGHLSRLINVIQGVTDDKDLSIRIAEEEQLYSRVSNILNTALQDADEKIQDGVINGDHVFLQFVCDVINDKLQDQDMNELHNAVVKYTRSDDIIVVNKRLCVREVLVSEAEESDLWVNEIVEEEIIKEKPKEKVKKIFKKKTRCCIF